MTKNKIILCSSFFNFDLAVQISYAASAATNTNNHSGRLSCFVTYSTMLIVFFVWPQIDYKFCYCCASNPPLVDFWMSCDGFSQSLQNPLLTLGLVFQDSKIVSSFFVSHGNMYCCCCHNHYLLSVVLFLVTISMVTMGHLTKLVLGVVFGLLTMIIIIFLLFNFLMLCFIWTWNYMEFCKASIPDLLLQYFFKKNILNGMRLVAL